MRGLTPSVNISHHPYDWQRVLTRTEQEYPFPDFRNERKCRDYDTIKRWNDRNAVDVKEFLFSRAPEGAEVHQMSWKFKDVHGYFDDHEDNGNHGSDIF